MGAVLALALALAACGSSGSPPTTGASKMAVPTAAPQSAASGQGASATTAGSSAGATAAPALDSPVTGVVVSVDSAGLAKVSGFTLRLRDGSQRAFRIGVLENGDQFPPGHLSEHLASASPVRVYFRPEGGALVVYRIEDAG